MSSKIGFYEVFSALFITTLLVSNIASTKIVALGSLVFDAGTVLFPLAYIVGDVVTEVYGYRAMRRLIYRGVAMLLLMTMTFWIVQILPAASDWTNQAAYDLILGVVWRIVAASVISLFVGEIANAYVMGRMKIATSGKGLWMRIIGSSAVGSLLDTVLFSVIAFVGAMPWATLFSLIVTVFCMKMAVEIAVSPITIRCISWVKKHDKTDIYEKPATFLIN